MKSPASIVIAKSEALISARLTTDSLSAEVLSNPDESTGHPFVRLQHIIESELELIKESEFSDFVLLASAFSLSQPDSLAIAKSVRLAIGPGATLDLAPDFTHVKTTLVSSEQIPEPSSSGDIWATHQRFRLMIQHA